MKARPLAALVWLIFVLVPPLRASVEGLARVVWPDIQPFVLLESLSPRWAPFTVIVALGFLGTWWLFSRLFEDGSGREREAEPARGREIQETRSRRSSPRAGGPTFEKIGLGVTLGWIGLAAVTGVLSYPFLLAGALVGAGLLSRGEPEPEPEPEPDPPLPLPEPIEPLELEDEDIPEEDWEDDTNYYRRYEWYFDEIPYRARERVHRFAAGVTVPKELYEELLDREHRVSGAEYLPFVEDQVDDPRVGRLAAWLRTICERKNFDLLDEIHLAMAFTLCMPYVYDDEAYGYDHAKYPVEMLVDKDGDCEDFSLLCAALLHRLGHQVALVRMDIAGADYGHLALGVVPPEPIEGVGLYCDAFGTEIFYCEVTPPADGSTTAKTTEVQWWLGRNPPNAARQFEVYAVGT